jgi:hypothetical protein
MRVIVVLLVFAGTCFAQFAQITGRVTDSSGAVMVGAKINVTNAGTGIVRKTESNAEGYYSVPVLPPGAYRMSVQADGFKPNGREAITLVVDQVARIDFLMEVGAVTESITVQSGAPLVDASTATVGKVVENRRIQELPLNGRNVLALIMLTPSVKSNAGPTQSGFLDRGVALSAVSINGGVGSTNNFVLDGANNNQPFHSDINANPTVDAIQEFKVQTNTMSAQYGFTGGGVVNIVSKSGANQLHGTLYEFVRNDAFDARNTFANSVAPFRYNQFGGSLGGPVVFPKLYTGKDRTFFFFNYEEWRHVSYANPIYTVPTPGERAGDFSETRDATGKLLPIYDPATTRPNPAGSGFVRDLFPNNVVPKERLDPVSLNMLRFYPLPNRTPTNVYTNANNYIANNKEGRHMRQYIPKIDERISDRHMLSARYMYYLHHSNGSITAAGAPTAVLPDPETRQRVDHLESHNFTLAETATLTPRLLNEFRLGLARLHFPFQVASYGKGWPQKLGLPASVPPDVLPNVSNGAPAFVSQMAGLRCTLTWQFFDMMTYVRGNHTLTFGGDIRLQQINNFQPQDASGVYNFPAGLTGNPQAQAGTGSAFATFLAGAVGSASINSYLGSSMVGRTMSYFFQDDWKVTPRLTLNLGMRYDYQPYPTERHNGVSAFRPWATNPLNGFLGRMEFAKVDFGASPYDNNKRDWGPRLGLAYDPGGSGKRVIRGGYSIFYPSIYWYGSFPSSTGFSSTPTAYNSSNSNLPAFQFKNGLPSPPTPPLGSALGPSAFLGQSVTFNERNMRTPMSQQWTVSVQQRLPGGWLLETAYSANRGTRLWSGSFDLNQLDNSYLGLGLALQDQVPNPYAGRVPGSLGNPTIARSQLLKPYPYYTAVNFGIPHIGSSMYHALLLSLERRLSSDFVLLASYTAGKLMSIGARQPVDFGAVEQIGFTGYRDGKFNRNMEWSVDPTDVSQRFVLSGVYELPFGKGKPFTTANRGVKTLISGWQANTVTIIQSGLPIAVRGANNFLADRPNSTGASARLKDPGVNQWFDTTVFVNPPNYAYGNVGRVLPDVRNPGVVNIDFSLVKSTSLGEKMRLQFRAEAFNALNHVNLGFPNVTFVPGPDGKNRSSSFGMITSARDPRMMQLGLKLIF